MNTCKRWILLLWTCCILLSGCNMDTPHDPTLGSPDIIADTAYFASIDPAQWKAECLQKCIEITGIVSADGHTTFYIGNAEDDGICISCTFDTHTKELSFIDTGDEVTIRGFCAAVIGNHIYLDHCALVDLSHPQGTESATIPSSHPETTQPTVEPTTVPVTTLPTVPPETSAPTIPPTTAAPTVPPEIEVPTVPPTTESPTVPPTTEAPTVPPTTVPEDNTDESHSSMVWIPKSGKKYHSDNDCSGMKDPTQVTKEEAENRGFTPCKKCYP